jgi:hypothetical protein
LSMGHGRWSIPTSGSSFIVHGLSSIVCSPKASAWRSTKQPAERVTA